MVSPTEAFATDQATPPPSATVTEMATRTPELAPTAGNLRPVALDNTYATAEDTPLVVGPPGVLGNDYDRDRDSLTAEPSLSDDGFTLNADGSFEFKPRLNFNGRVFFSYHAVDSTGARSRIAGIVITVTPVDDPCAAADPVRITFAPGAVEATLDFDVGQTKPIVLRAFAGQIMRVSVDPEPDLLRIRGGDGTELEDGHGSFWRGRLPATQDYYIEISNEDSRCDSMVGPLRVSIVVVPRAETTTWLDYRDEDNGFTLRYSDYFAEVEQPAFFFARPEGVLILVFTGNEYFSNTNLNHVFLTVDRRTEADAIATCTDLDYPPLLEPVDQLKINSVTFTRAHKSDQDIGGKRAHLFIHRTVHDDACWGVTFIIDYSDRLFFDQPIAEFDYDGILSHLRGVLATFEFIAD